MKKLTAKDPAEIVDYHHSWADRMLVNGVDTGDTIVTSADPDPAKHPKAMVLSGDIVVDTIVLNAKTQIIWLSGGSDFTEIDLIITTAQGRRYTQRVMIPVKER